MTSSSYRKAQNNFMTSLASYCVISYILQLKDRHNGNILVDRLGRVIRKLPLVFLSLWVER